MPAAGGIVISLARMNRILEVDIPNAQVVVEPGVINAHVTRRVAPHGYFYAPDPSSQSVCTIGGNVAENSGGAHCLKYGFTTTHVLALEVVLARRANWSTWARAPDAPGYDLPGVFVGSEGTLGVATKITLRIVKRPGDGADSAGGLRLDHEAAGQTVSDIIAAGMLPSAMEIMDALCHSGGGGRGACELSRVRRAAAGGAGRPGDEVDALMRAGAATLPKNGAWEIRAGAIGPGARAGLEGPQGRVCRDGPHLAQLHRAGRRDPADRASAIC